MQETGIINPILVQEIDGDLVLVDGLHRLQDARDNGDQPVDVAILEGDMVDLLCRNLLLDHLRGKPPVYEMVQVINTLYQEYDQDPDLISEKTGLPRDYIEKLLKIATASPEVLEALNQQAIGVGVAYELSRLPFPVQQEEVLAKTTVYRLRVKDVKELVDNTIAMMQEQSEQPPPSAPGEPAAPRKYYCEGCKQEVDPRYLRPVMVCPDCFGALWRLARAAEKAEEKAEETTGGD